MLRMDLRALEKIRNRDLNGFQRTAKRMYVNVHAYIYMFVYTYTYIYIYMYKYIHYTNVYLYIWPWADQEGPPSKVHHEMSIEFGTRDNTLTTP